MATSFQTAQLAEDLGPGDSGGRDLPGGMEELWSTGSVPRDWAVAGKPATYVPGLDRGWAGDSSTRNRTNGRTMEGIGWGTKAKCPNLSPASTAAKRAAAQSQQPTCTYLRASKTIRWRDDMEPLAPEPRETSQFQFQAEVQLQEGIPLRTLLA
ncbi:hypothetical protein VDGL01_03814 [Verticillium dahliae]